MKSPLTSGLLKTNTLQGKQSDITFHNKRQLHTERYIKYSSLLLIIFVIFTSCNTLENASIHGLKSGHYKLQSEQKSMQNVYADITDEKIDLYHETEKQPDKNKFQTISLKPTDTLITSPIVLSKKSLDIDITAILLKYRPSVNGLPGQLTTDFNIALYAGWRHDTFKIKGKTDPLKKGYNKVSNWGYDFGLFAGPGGTQINPFTTQNQRTYEYNAMIMQTGIAGFIESNIASFGVSIGIDYLLNSDKEVWIYTNKPWVGFIVGIALN
jgi:hypothetical protein